MAFNAKWEFQVLADDLGVSCEQLLSDFRSDLEYLVSTCPPYALGVKGRGNCFTLAEPDGEAYKPKSEPGLYAIFSILGLVYFGEASDLMRRQLVDPDNTADSTKVFSNQGRAILKLITHKGWAGALGLQPLFMQLFSASTPLRGRTFESAYRVSKYSKALEGAGALFIHAMHPQMLDQARKRGFNLKNEAR